MHALQKKAARIALSSLASHAGLHERDHLGGGLDLIPALLMTQAVLPAGRGHYTLEHAHTSIGYYSVLCALGYLDEQGVIEHFRRSLAIAGHVSWVPGGTPLNGGRLGVMVPAGVGYALGLKALEGEEAWYICHCGDAGCLSGQALNGFKAAHAHQAPISFVMHRNGIQLSGATASIMDNDPRPIFSSLGIEIIEVHSLADTQELYAAYRYARQGAREGRPNLIYPTGYRSSNGDTVSVRSLGERYRIESDVAAFAEERGVDLDREIWIPGSLLSYRDVHSMLECVFLVNELPGGALRHDGHMKSRNLAEVLAKPMLTDSDEEARALEELKSANPVMTVSQARPAPGTLNLVLSDEQVAGVELPLPGKQVSLQAGVEKGYRAVAEAFPENCFVISCDLDASTKLESARQVLGTGRSLEMSRGEKASGVMANGLAVSTDQPQLVVFSTFPAFFEGLAREGLEMWRDQRNLNGGHEGLNVTFHLSQVGACSGRDHFSGSSLDWINLAMSYLPYLDRFYTPADARGAFVAVRDLAAHYGAHIIGIPRDSLPILTRQGSGEPLFAPTDAFEAVTCLRKHEGAGKALLAMGATAYLAADAVDELAASGLPADAYVINGLPLDEGTVQNWIQSYPGGLVTLEDGLIATPETGLRGFASLVSSAADGSGLPLGHLGIEDPGIAPSNGREEVWAHVGITQTAIVESLREL
jgi:transketolase N-terminal domain/subunit